MFRVRYSILPAAVLLVMSMSCPGLTESRSVDQVQHRQDRSVDAAAPTWPHGTYGLPKPRTGCPNSQFIWDEGWRLQDTENDNSSNQWSADPLHLDGEWNSTNDMMQTFCMKTQSVESLNWFWSWFPSQWTQWPPGAYCLFKYGSCPPGFQTGRVKWDDEDDDNANDHGGYVPSGWYYRNTVIDFCCRNDTTPDQEIVLPTEDNFYLFPHSDQCQAVRGMNVTNEWFRWDTENDRNVDRVDGTHPYYGKETCPVTLRNSILLHYCYYERM